MCKSFTGFHSVIDVKIDIEKKGTKERWIWEKLENKRRNLKKITDSCTVKKNRWSYKFVLKFNSMKFDYSQ